MKNTLRNFFWRLLGMEYYRYLKGQKKTYLDRTNCVTIGYKTYHNGAFVWRWYPSSHLKIGAYCSIANDVHFILDDGLHQLSEVTSFPHLNHLNDEQKILKDASFLDFKENHQKKYKGITVGNDVWIGMKAIVLPNVKIGNGATIMAGAVVTKDVPDFAVVGGVPAKIIKMKHTPEQIVELNQISWWDWSPEKVEDNLSDFYISIEDFISKWRCT